MPLMSGIYVGTSGLQANQNALNTTAHNLSNMDTVGYTRQQAEMTNRIYTPLSKNIVSVSNMEYGMGTQYADAKQVRDYFLDLTYRKENGRCNFYNVLRETYGEVESLLGELDGEAFEKTTDDLWTAIQELSKDPSSSVTQGLFVQRAEEFVERAVNIYDNINFYQDNLNTQIAQKVKQINDYGKQLLNINDQIRKVEADGIEHANDLRDVRNNILDSLSELAEIEYKDDIYGNITVKIEGVDFVKGSTCYEIMLQTDETTGFYTPFWPQDAEYIVLENGTKKYDIEGADVFDLYSREISSDMNNDIGALKAMLLARGDKRATYQDVENNYNHIAPSAIMNIQGEFDQMIHNVVTAVNDIFAQAAGCQVDDNGEFVKGDLTLADGTVLTNVRFVEQEIGGYMRKEDGSPIQIFDKITTNAYEKVTGADGKTYFVYNEENPAASDSLYTLRNIRIDQELKQMPSIMGFILKDGSIDQKTAEGLKGAFTAEKYLLNPEIKKKSNFVTYYTDMVSQLANKGYVNKSIYENQLNTVESTRNSREQVLGVSSDEELSNMIKFQNAYNASSRYINTVSQMLEHLITALAN